MANPISPKPTADEGVEMSEILRPCPFCGGTKICTEKGINLNYCDNCSAESNVEHWNNRPIEDALNARIAELRGVISDYRNDASRVLDEKCPSDERHCGCVPILRDQLNKYQKALILITTMPELSQATIAREALQERGKFIWTEQSVGEYWVTKLDILQDKFDTLEKDYADVCQKRLEAADVFSRQIIELESENAELKADLKNKNARIAELEAELTELKERFDITDELLKEATETIGAVVACCTYNSNDDAKIGIYGIDQKAFTRIDQFMTHYNDAISAGKVSVDVKTSTDNNKGE